MLPLQRSVCCCCQLLRLLLLCIALQSHLHALLPAPPCQRNRCPVFCRAGSWPGKTLLSGWRSPRRAAAAAEGGEQWALRAGLVHGPRLAAPRRGAHATLFVVGYAATGGGVVPLPCVQLSWHQRRKYSTGSSVWAAALVVCCAHACLRFTLLLLAAHVRVYCCCHCVAPGVARRRPTRPKLGRNDAAQQHGRRFVSENEGCVITVSTVATLSKGGKGVGGEMC